MKMSNIAAWFRGWFVMDNDTCPICGRILFDRDAYVCANCMKRFTANRGPVCTRCGRALLDDRETLCKACQRVEDPGQAFDGGFSWLAYDDIAAKLMTGFKFHYRRALAFWTGQQMARAAREDASAILEVDMVVPVPLHPNRERERGYNQSLKLAEGIAVETGLPVRDDLLFRRVDTPHQLGADRVFRLANVTGAFAVRSPERLAGKRVILVDDVMTTSATLRACTKALKTAGAAQVVVMTAAAIVSS